MNIEAGNWTLEINLSYGIDNTKGFKNQPNAISNRIRDIQAHVFSVRHRPFHNVFHI